MDTARPPFPVEREALSLLEVLWREGHGGYLVGGGVRDALLGLDVDDWDIATDARPERILHLFPGSSYQNRFGTVLARGLEITTFRRDHSYADHRRPDTVTFSQDIFEDLARRDLTINAIAWGRRGPDAAARIVDPADGRGDLVARLVRAVGDPARRFEEDALRLLRAIRIAAKLDFAIEPVTRAAMEAHAGDVAWVSEERIGSELRRMLAGPRPSRAFRAMGETGILGTIVPELEALPPDVLELALEALERTTSDHPGQERLALAALFGPLDDETVRGILLRLRLGAREAGAVASLVAAASEPYDRTWSDADVRRYMGRLPAGLQGELLRLRAANAAARSGRDASTAADGLDREVELAQRIRRQQDAASPLTLAQLAVDGRDLREALGLPEGPIIGTILDRLLADVIDEPALNTRMTLLTRASLILEGLMQRNGGAAGPAPPAIR